jgi:hypothetical protein
MPAMAEVSTETADMIQMIVPPGGRTPSPYRRMSSADRTGLRPLLGEASTDDEPDKTRSAVVTVRNSAMPA